MGNEVSAVSRQKGLFGLLGCVSRKQWTGLYGVADEWNVPHVAAFPAVLWDKDEVKPEQKWCRSHQKEKKGFVESV